MINSHHVKRNQKWNSIDFILNSNKIYLGICALYIYKYIIYIFIYESKLMNEKRWEIFKISWKLLNLRNYEQFLKTPMTLLIFVPIFIGDSVQLLFLMVHNFPRWLEVVEFLLGGNKFLQSPEDVPKFQITAVLHYLIILGTKYETGKF